MWTFSSKTWGFIRQRPLGKPPRRNGGDSLNEFFKVWSFFPSLSATDENGGLGTHHFHLKRIRREHPSGDDPLWRDENDASGARPRTGGKHCGNRCDGQFRSGWPDSFGRCGKIRRRHGEIEKCYCRTGGTGVLPHGETGFTL